MTLNKVTGRNIYSLKNFASLFFQRKRLCYLITFFIIMNFKIKKYINLLLGNFLLSHIFNMQYHRRKQSSLLCSEWEEVSSLPLLSPYLFFFQESSLPLYPLHYPMIPDSHCIRYHHEHTPVYIERHEAPQILIINSEYQDMHQIPFIRHLIGILKEAIDSTYTYFIYNKRHRHITYQGRNIIYDFQIPPAKPETPVSTRPAAIATTKTHILGSLNFSGCS